MEGGLMVENLEKYLAKLTEKIPDIKSRKKRLPIIPSRSASRKYCITSTQAAKKNTPRGKTPTLPVINILIKQYTTTTAISGWRSGSVLWATVSFEFCLGQFLTGRI